MSTSTNNTTNNKNNKTLINSKNNPYKDFFKILNLYNDDTNNNNLNRNNINSQDKIICLDCKKINYQSEYVNNCERCNKTVCPRCLFFCCKMCCQMVCQKCLLVNECNEKYCRKIDHNLKKCLHCSKIVCNSCFKWEHFLIKCDTCNKSMCTKSVSTCKTCAQRICLNCENSHYIDPNGNILSCKICKTSQLKNRSTPSKLCKLDFTCKICNNLVCENCLRKPIYSSVSNNFISVYKDFIPDKDCKYCQNGICIECFNDEKHLVVKCPEKNCKYSACLKMMNWKAQACQVCKYHNQVDAIFPVHCKPNINCVQCSKQAHKLVCHKCVNYWKNYILCGCGESYCVEHDQKTIVKNFTSRSCINCKKIRKVVEYDLYNKHLLVLSKKMVMLDSRTNNINNDGNNKNNINVEIESSKLIPCVYEIVLPKSIIKHIMDFAFSYYIRYRPNPVVENAIRKERAEKRLKIQEECKISNQYFILKQLIKEQILRQHLL